MDFEDSRTRLLRTLLSLLQPTDGHFHENNRGGFGFVWIGIRTAWIAIRKSLWIHTGPFVGCFTISQRYSESGHYILHLPWPFCTHPSPFIQCRIFQAILLHFFLNICSKRCTHVHHPHVDSSSTHPSYYMRIRCNILVTVGRLIVHQCQHFFLQILQQCQRLWYSLVLKPPPSIAPWVIKNSCTGWGSREWHHKGAFIINGYQGGGGILRFQCTESTGGRDHICTGD